MGLFNNHKTFAGNFYDPMGFFGGKKKGGGGGYEYMPYSGLRPPRIDTDETKILRPTQKQLFEILMRRSLGNDVGYDPARRSAQESLIKNSLAAQEEDQLRSAQGAIASSGLSGNPRAYEALAGRVKRDTGRNMENALSRISIEDLTRASDERDLNTARLQGLNQFNFGQENKAADFDLSVYNSEQGFRQGAFDRNEGVRRYDQTRSDESFSDLTNLGLNAADLYLTSQGAPPGTASSVSALLGKQTGQGIAPSTGSFYQPLRGTAGVPRAYRYVAR